jgi:hypothetical protein
MPDAARAGPIAAASRTLAFATRASTARSITVGSTMWDLLELRRFNKEISLLAFLPHTHFKWDEKAEMAPRRLRWTNGKS